MLTICQASLAKFFSNGNIAAGLNKKFFVVIVIVVNITFTYNFTLRVPLISTEIFRLFFIFILGISLSNNIFNQRKYHKRKRLIFCNLYDYKTEVINARGLICKKIFILAKYTQIE